MNRKFLSIYVIFLAASFLFTGCSTSKPAYKNTDTLKTITQDLLHTNSTVKLNDYNINVELAPEQKLLSGTEKIKFTNSLDGELSEIYIHIYPNAYKKESTAPVLFDSESTVYPKGFNPGSIDIISIKSDGKDLSYKIEGSDESILKVSPASLLKSGESLDISIDFKIHIPENVDRLGELNGTFNFGNWYPILAVYDQDGWNLDPYYKIGDPFYSDASNYDVTISVPKNYKVAATGEQALEKSEADKNIYEFKESNVRDFAWVASDKFRVEESVVDDINIKCYFISDDIVNNALAKKTAEDSIKTYNKYYGKYPYKNYSVVETNFSSGMEYPEIVFIRQQYYSGKNMLNALEATIAHETAHQWWYSAVGNDEVDEAWLDESFACYSESIYYEEKDNSRSYYNKILNSYNQRSASIKGDKKILKPVYKFAGWNDYGPLVYNKGAVMLNTLREKAGDETFFKIINTYYERYKFKNARTENFISVVEEVTGQKWNDFFDKWLLDK